jgi:putative acetyltransferase
MKLPPETVHIREERPGDVPAIHDVVSRACRADEAKLVDALRDNGAALLSLVAEVSHRIVGHILYSPVYIDGTSVTGAGLGPMGVVPDLQRQGIGSRLVEAGNHRLRDRGCPFIAVLGHPTFYPRFGFRPASQRGIRCGWEVPDDVFMVLVLDGYVMAPVSGLAKYRDEFLSL